MITSILFAAALVGVGILGIAVGRLLSQEKLKHYYRANKELWTLERRAGVLDAWGELLGLSIIEKETLDTEFWENQRGKSCKKR